MRPARRPAWPPLLTHLALVLALGPAAWLAWPEDPPPVDPPADLDRHPSMTGRLVDVEERSFALARPDGPVARFTVREGDRGRFDLLHLREHARAGIPTRVWYAREGGGLRALFQQDEPVASLSPGAARGTRGRPARGGPTRWRPGARAGTAAAPG